MSTKAALKAAKAAIDKKNWPEAADQASTALSSDSKNYFAHLFLGRANEGLGKPDLAISSYEKAIELKPDDPQAYLGLRALYEKHPRKDAVDAYTRVGLRLAEIYINTGEGDAHKAQTAIDKAVDFARKHGGPKENVNALKIQLPTSPIYDFLSGRLPHPAATLERIASLLESSEASTISSLIADRKTRIGATLESTTIAVKQEVFGQSELEDIYQAVIDWTQDDEVRREYEEKLLMRAYEHLLVLPKGGKREKREKVERLAHGMVVIRHPMRLAWMIELEWRSSGRDEVAVC